MKKLRLMIFATLAALAASANPNLGTTSAAQASPKAPSKSQTGTKDVRREISGTVKSVTGTQIAVQTGNGEILKVDASQAIKDHLSVSLSVGTMVAVKGTSDAKGVIHAESILRSKGAAAGAPSAH